MYQQFTHTGPTPSSSSKIDRTRILDPKDYWREPASCPDWPLTSPNRIYSGQGGRAGAEDRLQNLGHFLNRGEGALRIPTDEEREQQFAATFRRTGSHWHALGLHALSPLGRLVESDAELMMEACHIRGYLRKLEAKGKAEAEAADARRVAEARRTLEDYRANAPAEIAAIDDLAEAVARHKQREEDERAVSHRYGLWQQLNARHAAAVQAAHTLGLSVPDAPEVLG